MDDDSALGQLIGSYLNEDVFAFYGSVLGAVDAFVVDDPELASRVPSEIDDLVAQAANDQQLEHILSTHAIGFVPGEITYREWLAKIADRVRAATTS